MSRLSANLLLLLAAAIWGSTFVAQKLAFVGIDGKAVADPDSAIGAFAFTGARFLIGALVVLPLALREARRATGALDRKGQLGFVACGAALFLGAWLQQEGIIRTSVSNAGFLTGLYVAMVPVMAWGLFGRRPIWAIWPAVVACVGGTYLLNGGTLSALSEGDMWVLVGALFWALHVNLVGLVVVHTQRPLTLAASQFLVAGILGLGLAAPLEAPGIAAFVTAAPEILYAGALSVGVAFTLQVVAQRYTHPAAAAVLLSSEMVFAALAGAIVLGERLAPVQMAGGALILAGIIAVEVLPILWRQRRRAQPASGV